MDKNGRDGSNPTALWRVAAAIYIRAVHFHRRIDNASVGLSACRVTVKNQVDLFVGRRNIYIEINKHYILSIFQFYRSRTAF